MRRLLLAAALAPAGCIGPPPPETNVPVPRPEASPEALPGPERAGFVLRRGADTVSTERTSRTRDLLTGDLDVRGQGGVEYQLSLEPTQLPTRLVAGVIPANASDKAAATQRSTVEFRGDTAILSTVQGDSTRTVRVATRAGAIPYINPSMALVEQMLRRARVVGGAQVELPVFLAGSGGQTVSASITFVGSDSARVALGDTEMRLATDRAGRVLGGTVPAQGITIERAAELPAAP